VSSGSTTDGTGTNGRGEVAGANGRRPGRPRSERARQAILQAAGELLLTGAGGEVSMDALAAHAGVSKATIYRWWPDREALALDALYEQWADRGDAPPDLGSLRGDLLALLRPWARLVRSRPYAPVIGAFITKAHNDPAFAQEYVTRLVQPRRDRAKVVFDRAVDRGELPRGAPVETALDLLYGAIYHRLLHRHAPLTDTFVTQVLDLTLDGLLGGSRPAKTPTHRTSTTKTEKRS
jgi:AcrR family transcriptional regulator